VEISKIIEESKIGESTQRIVFEGSDGATYEKLIQRIDKNSGLLESVVLRKSRQYPNPKIEVKETIRPLDAVQTPMSAQKAEDAETLRKRLIEERFMAKAAKKARREAAISVAQMDEDDLAEEKIKSEEQKALEKIIKERNEQAIKNVDAIQQAKSKMINEGKNPQEIKKSIRDLKKKQRDGRGPGRPKTTALNAPKKDPVTGEFYSSKK